MRCSRFKELCHFIRGSANPFGGYRHFLTAGGAKYSKIVNKEGMFINEGVKSGGRSYLDAGENRLPCKQLPPAPCASLGGSMSISSGALQRDLISYQTVMARLRAISLRHHRARGWRVRRIDWADSVSNSRRRGAGNGFRQIRRSAEMSAPTKKKRPR